MMEFILYWLSRIMIRPKKLAVIYVVDDVRRVPVRRSEYQRTEWQGWRRP